MPFEVRRWEAPDLPPHRVIWNSWWVWRGNVKNPVNDLVVFVDVEQMHHAPQPDGREWGEGTVGWDDVFKEAA